MKKLITFLAILTFSCSENFSFNNPFQNNQEAEKIEISQEFVQGSEDIPLIFGMIKTEDDTIGFDSSEGSIISSSYEFTKSKEGVKEFYLKSLPELGWQITDENENKLSLKRENEELQIEFTVENQQQIVTFFISSSL